MTQNLDNRHFVTGSELRQVMKHLMQTETYFIAGANSVYVPAGRKKYLDKAVCRLWQDLGGDWRLMAPGEAVRTELTRQWPDLDRVGWAGKQVALFDKRSPMHYTGPAVGQFSYIDLDAAYSQLYARLWLDTSYPRSYYGRFPLADVAYSLRDWKLARNSLIGLCRSREGVAYKGRKRIPLKMKNKYLSPGLWATVQSLLHWIASKAISLGAIYLNVDGYVFRKEDTEFMDEFLLWLSENGLEWSIRAEGGGEIVGWNNYQIGDRRTQQNRLGLTQNSKEFTNVDNSNGPEWSRYWDGCRRIHSNTART